MKMVRNLIFLCLLTAFSVDGSKGQGDFRDKTETMRGVCFVAPKDKLTSNPFQPVKKLGANYVAVVPYAFCQQNKPRVNYDYARQWWGETVEGTQQTIRYAREKNLKVKLKPHLWVGGEGWPGSLSFENDDQLATWQSSYTDYILRFARMAEKMNVELFTIGTECKQLVRDHPEFWRSLIEKVKKVYQGEVTYQANWDNVKHVSFWDQLDYISVSGYFPVADKPKPPKTTIAENWEKHLKMLERVHMAYQKPVLFGEYGYCSKEGTLIKPWKGGRKDQAPVSMKAQEKGYEVLFSQVWEKTWFHGGFLWKWFENHQNAGGAGDNRYTPQNKPAEKVIEKFYSME